MLNSPTQTRLNTEDNINNNNHNNKISIDILLAHQLAHALIDQNHDRFIFIYDNRIPATFDQIRVSSFVFFSFKIFPTIMRSPFFNQDFIIIIYLRYTHSHIHLLIFILNACIIYLYIYIVNGYV
jgi:hypothetical protein